MPTMPNVVGLLHDAALAAMVTAGVRVVPLGYFQEDPVSIVWSQTAGKPGFVTAQNVAAGSNMAANSPVTLTAVEFPFSVAYPAGGGNV